MKQRMEDAAKDSAASPEATRESIHSDILTVLFERVEML